MNQQQKQINVKGMIKSDQTQGSFMDKMCSQHNYYSNGKFVNILCIF